MGEQSIIERCVVGAEGCLIDAVLQEFRGRDDQGGVKFLGTQPCRAEVCFPGCFALLKLPLGCPRAGR